MHNNEQSVTVLDMNKFLVNSESRFALCKYFIYIFYTFYITCEGYILMPKCTLFM